MGKAWALPAALMEKATRAAIATSPLFRGCRHPEDRTQGRAGQRLGNQQGNGFQKADLGYPGQGPGHFSPGERVPGIMHDTVKVIGLSQGLHFLNLHLQEVILLPCKEREKSGGGWREWPVSSLYL